MKVRVNKRRINPFPPPLECGIFDRGGEIGFFTRPSFFRREYFLIYFSVFRRPLIKRRCITTTNGIRLSKIEQALIDKDYPIERTMN